MRPIVSSCGTFYHETAKSLVSYLSPLATNEHTINNTLDFADLLQDKTLEQDEIMVSYIIPYCKANEQQSYAFIKKLERFTRGHYKFAIIWQTKKLTSMFRLKDINIHPSHVVPHGTCADCSASCIGESCRNCETRKQEHEDATKQYEPAQHLREYPYHHFNWRVIAIAHPLGIKRILDSMFISKFQPCLNKQVHSYTLNLFPKGIT